MFDKCSMPFRLFINCNYVPFYAIWKTNVRPVRPEIIKEIAVYIVFLYQRRDFQYSFNFLCVHFYLNEMLNAFIQKNWSSFTIKFTMM